LKLASKDDQRAVIALHRSVARNPKLPEAERIEARRKAAALEKLLGLKKRRWNTWLHARKRVGVSDRRAQDHLKKRSERPERTSRKNVLTSWNPVAPTLLQNQFPPMVA
jgi:hypothetical protein